MAEFYFNHSTRFFKREIMKKHLPTLERAAYVCLADYLKFFSGNAGLTNAPQLVIQYYVP